MKSVVALFAVLGASVAAQMWSWHPAATGTFTPELRSHLLREIQGWKVSDLPIGDTELLRRAAVDTLRFDDYVYRSYSRAGVNFTIFVTYWADRKQPPQLVAQHTPDRCWIANGAVCEEARHNIVYRISDVELAPAQWRRFRNPDHSIIYVLFWHRVGNHFFDYGDRSAYMLNPMTSWVEAVRYFAGGSSEQYFTRITSTVAPEELWKEPGFTQAFDELRILGVVIPSPARATR